MRTVIPSMPGAALGRQRGRPSCCGFQDVTLLGTSLSTNMEVAFHHLFGIRKMVF